MEDWSDERSLMRMGADPWRIRDACEGTMIFGATGAGKTSGSGQAIALSYLAAGFGGLVLCAKKDEPDQWRRYAEATGRAADLVFFGSAPNSGFNFLEFEASRPGEGAGLTENLVNLFTEVASIGTGNGGAAEDPFWERAMKSLVRNAIDLCRLAGEPLSLLTLYEAIQSAPESPGQASQPEWRARSACWSQLQAAEARATGTRDEPDFRQVAGYWLGHFPGMGDRTRGSIVAMFLSIAESLMRGRMRELFCSQTTVSPLDVLRGRVVVVDLPVKEWAEVGRFAAVLWKYCVQKAVERRADPGRAPVRPVFLWADECQHFVSRYDQLFQATARSSRAATVYLTQNYPNLLAAIGAERAGRAVVDSLLGNLGTKLFHANADRDTNQFAAELIGRRLQRLRNDGRSANFGGGSGFSIGASNSHGTSEHMDFSVQPSEFAQLRRGGRENQLVAEAYVYQGGRVWTANGRTWQKAAFRQDCAALLKARAYGRAR